MVRKFESNQITKNDVVISLVGLLDGYTEVDLPIQQLKQLPIQQLKRYDGGFSIIMEDGKVFDVSVAEGESYYY